MDGEGRHLVRHERTLALPRQGRQQGWFAEQATGSWTALHSDPQPTVEQAKHIAEVVDAGAHWLGWAKYRSLTWAEIQRVSAEAAK